MANYVFTVISNYFEVKDSQEVAEVLSNLGYEESYCNKSNNTVCLASCENCWSDEHRVVIDRATKKMVAVINAYDLDDFELDDTWISEMELTEYKLDDLKDISITEYIQHQLVPNSYFAVKEVGNEKLRYNIGYAEVITKNNVKWFNLDMLIETYIAEELSLADDTEVQLKM